MTSLRTLSTVLGVAAFTSAVSLATAWPHATFADGRRGLMGRLDAPGTRIADVVVSGEVKRDPKSKSGWEVEVTARNDGDHAETFELETDLERTVRNPMSRSGAMPTAVWKQNETLTLAAGESVARRYDVPAAIGTQLAASARAETSAAARNAKGIPSLTSRTAFAVGFQKAHA